ncbi:MAG: PadR family transcriptional regulator [Thaumarchaeota archaeon]|nr:PadR family transcriptional regulator [Nitrososphaerota archaeon]
MVLHSVAIVHQRPVRIRAQRPLKTRFGFWSGNVTAYRVLYNLEKYGLVKSEAQERRRYYKITEAGRREVVAARNFLQNIIVESEETKPTTRVER